MSVSHVQPTGRLSRSQRHAFARAVVLAQLGALSHRLRQALGEWGRRSALVEGRQPPDSALTRWAFELADEACDPPLFRHCVRCWYWGDLLAQLDRLEFDPEQFYLACLLHDLGLSDRYRPALTDKTHCFAVHGATVARRELTARGVANAAAEVVADAIGRHMDMRGDRKGSAEAYLLHEATHLDVGGSRTRDLPRAVRRAVLNQEPRHGFVQSFGQHMAREAIERPDSRAAVVWHLGLHRTLHHNPLDRRPRP